MFTRKRYFEAYLHIKEYITIVNYNLFIPFSPLLNNTRIKSTEICMYDENFRNLLI
jgi:hypothetical protein